MTDQIPADKVREILDEWERIKEYADWDDLDTLVKDIRALLPPPPLPTLADMTEDDLAECQWMQADTEARGRAVVVVPEWGAGHAELLDRWGNSFYAAHDTITPRPGLPRLEWPGDQQPAPAPALPDGWRLADHPEHGRVVVTDDTPGLDGWVYGVFASDMDGTGFDWHPYDPGELTLLDTPAPPPNTLALGSIWDDTDALADPCEESGRDQITVTDKDGYAFIWAHDAEWWEGSAKPIDAPFTIIHTGRKDDQ